MATTTYKNHTITADYVQSGSNWKGVVTTTGPQIANKTDSTGLYVSKTAPGLSQAMSAIVVQHKNAIDTAVATPGTTTPGTTTPGTTTPGTTTPGTTTPGTTTTPSTTANTAPTTDIAPAPQIVWGTAATPPAAGVNYQERRNGQAADNIYSQMNGTTYASGTQAETDFRVKLQNYVNSNGGSISINAQTGAITGTPNADWTNTLNIVKQYVLQRFGKSSWDQVASGNTDVSGTTGTGAGTAENPTSNADVNATWQVTQDSVNEINSWLTDAYDANIADWQNRLTAVPDVQANITTRLTDMRNSFASAAENLKAGGDLEKKAQAIYSNQNIDKMKQQLISKGFDVSKAGPAVFFKAMKDRAVMSADIYKLQADTEKTLANLEAQKAQLVDGIHAAGLAADQWVTGQLNEITKQIQTVRDNYATQKAQNVANYTITPLINVMSNQFQADLQNLTMKYQEQYLNANPSQKIVAAAKIYGSDWAYVNSSVALNTTGTFGEYLARCADSIRAGKIAEATAKATTVTNTTTVNTQGTV